jgi:hypothetical protein
VTGNRRLPSLVLRLIATAFLVAVTMLAPSGLDGADTAAQQGAPPVVTVGVDLSSPKSAKSEMGFLHGLKSASPPTRRIAPLRPALWRGTPATVNVERAGRLGARFVLVLSDLWGYPGMSWYGRRPPWEDYESWRAFVAQVAEEWKGRPIIWDVWNEPDVPYFWNGTAEQFYETYRIAATEIRNRAGPRARIAGPSTSVFRWSWIQGLLRSCAVATCEVNTLSWHELLRQPTSISSVPAHLRRARASLMEGMTASKVALRKIIVGERVDAHDNLSAGEQVAYLAALELGGADGSVLACWKDPSGFDNCNATTLDGLLDHRTGRPRPAWWASKWYARGLAGRVTASVTDDSVSVIASVTAHEDADIVAGYYDPHVRLVPAEVDVELRISGLRRIGIASGDVTIRVSRVGGGGGAGVKPRESPPITARAEHGKLTVDVGRVALHDALHVQIGAAASATEPPA